MKGKSSFQESWKCLLNLKLYIAIEPIPVSPCSGSICGANAICEDRYGVAICSCKRTYIGQPPNCRPECVTNSECSSNKACINYKCEDPCAGLCGFNANCVVRQHLPFCTCLENYEGNPYNECRIKPKRKSKSLINFRISIYQN